MLAPSTLRSVVVLVTGVGLAAAGVATLSAVRTVKDHDAVAELPALSLTLKLTVLRPSGRSAGGVNVTDVAVTSRLEACGTGVPLTFSTTLAVSMPLVASL